MFGNFWINAAVVVGLLIFGWWFLAHLAPWLRDRELKKKGLWK